MRMSIPLFRARDIGSGETSVNLIGESVQTMSNTVTTASVVTAPSKWSNRSSNANPAVNETCSHEAHIDIQQSIRQETPEKKRNTRTTSCTLGGNKNVTVVVNIASHFAWYCGLLLIERQKVRVMRDIQRWLLRIG